MLWLVWSLLLIAIGLGSYAAIAPDIQLLIALLSMMVLPIPVGMTTGKMGRTILAACLPFLCMMAMLLVVPKPNLIRGQVPFSGLILPVACANALCPPPYRLSILLSQSLWVWYEAALFWSRGYLDLAWALGMALMGPVVFLLTAMMGRAVPVAATPLQDGDDLPPL